MINLSSFIAFHARRTPDRCALKYRGEDVSYAEFDARIRRVGGWLASRGIGPGDVVAVLMKNSTAFLELVFATSHIGPVFLPINFRLSADEVGYIVGNSGARTDGMKNSRVSPQASRRCGCAMSHPSPSDAPCADIARPSLSGNAD